MPGVSNSLKFGAGLAVVAGGLLWYFTSFCCTTGLQAEHARVFFEMARLSGAQQAFFRQHQRYADDLIELRFQPQSRVLLDFVFSDSSLQVRGTSARYPEITCLFQVTPDTKAVGPPACADESVR
jgi:hypothetical protein